MGRLDGKVALISGGARGQGAAEARLFAAEGAQVVIGDVLDERGRATAAEIGAAASYVHLDVRSEGDWAGALDHVAAQHGALHVLVNNAGVTGGKPLLESSTAEYLDVININLLGTFLGMRTAAPLIRDSGGGAIVNISSMMGFAGGPARGAYVSSKFAVRGLTKVAALEFGPLGIRVNSIHPGAIDTDMVRPEVRSSMNLDDLPIPRLGRADEVAKLALFLASDESSYSTGAEFIIDGGWLAGV